MKFFKPDGRFGWQGLAKIITADDISQSTYISTPFTVCASQVGNLASRLT